MDLTSRIDEYGKPAWITLMVLGFVLFWPIGLVILAFLIGSGRMGCYTQGRGRWYAGGNEKQDGRPRRRRRRRRHDPVDLAPSGNVAFDEYRDETLQRLEKEQTDFVEFLERLRHAKDKAEFDQFMSEQRTRTNGADSAEGTASDDAPDAGPEGRV